VIKFVKRQENKKAELKRSFVGLVVNIKKPYTSIMAAMEILVL